MLRFDPASCRRRAAGARGAGNDRGIALVLTLLILALIVTATFEIFRIGIRSARTGAYGRDAVRAAQLAQAGVGAARIALREDAKNNDFDTLDEIWSRPVPPIDLGEGVIIVEVEDEERKININRLILPKGNAPDDQRLAVFRRLLDILAIDPNVADAVIDWLDNDDTPRLGGAESAYYLSLPFPYRAKNDLFDTIDELRLVRGVTPEVFAKLKPFVTVYSSGKVNINTAPKEVLMSLAAGKDAADGGGPIDEALAALVIEYRKDNPFRKPSEIGNVSPALARLQSQTLFGQLIDTRSTAFRIRSTGEVNGTRRTIDTVGVRSGNDIQWRYRRAE